MAPGLFKNSCRIFQTGFSSVNGMPEMCFYFANSVCIHFKEMLGQNYFVDVDGVFF